ncbi:sulfurtransferase [Flavobacteriales bacterium]|nr:sulfurtransferase [Flavobacteriales bacterium]
MNWNNLFIAWTISLSLISCGGAAKIDEAEQLNSVDQEPLDTLVVSEQLESESLMYVDELRNFFDDTSIILIDFREENAYNEGHIPRAKNIYRKDITITEDGISGFVAPKAMLEDLLSRLGVDSTKQLIVYDGRGACEAARFWWTMNYYGFTDVKVLNGDYDLWASKEYPINKEVASNQTTKFVFPESTIEQYSATKEDVIKALTDTSIIIVDTRTIEEYRGVVLKKGAKRQGRIPGSVNLDWANSIHFNDGLKFKSLKDLLYDFKNIGITKDKEVIFYCQSGTRSAHSVFVLAELLGFKKVKNYDGSWIEWSHDLELEIEMDTLVQ